MAEAAELARFVRGEPACANHLLFDALRNKWGFKGYVVSDCWAISDLHQGHGYVLTLEQAAALGAQRVMLLGL